MNCNALLSTEKTTNSTSYGVIFNCATHMIYRRGFNYANYVATCVTNIGIAERTNVESGGKKKKEKKKAIHNIVMMQYLVKSKCNKYRKRR